MEVKCLQCGHNFKFNGASCDENGWHTNCPKCDGSFDIDIEKYLVPRGTRVVYCDDWTNKKVIGIIDGNDLDGCDEEDEFENINYYIIPLEHINDKAPNNYYEMLLREDFEICK